MSENLPDPAEQNVERLLSEAYQPEDIPSDFAERTLARLEGIAAERRRRKPSPPEPSPWKRVAWLYFANAVAIVLLIILPALFWHYFIEPAREQKEKEEKKKTTPADRDYPRSKTTTPTPKTSIPGQT